MIYKILGIPKYFLIYKNSGEKYEKKKDNAMD